MARPVAPALRALLSNCIDYAGLFPPTSLPVEIALGLYRQYAAGEFAWMLGNFVVAQKELLGTFTKRLSNAACDDPGQDGMTMAAVSRIPPELDGRLTVVGNSDHRRASSIEAKMVVATSKPTYCEVPITELNELQRLGSFAKLRMGGVTAVSIPSVDHIVQYIETCAQLALPLKATAGLRHPIRSVQALTYESDAPQCTVHGFINFLMAAAFAHFPVQTNVIRNILEETDPAAFRFNDSAQWRDHSLTTDQIVQARRDFVHSFGSCSFADPINGLQRLGWL